ncbi:FadR/GntR family transcriptional regulator [Nocardioides yefusunii]|uniref:FadR/GntR family transcriptional regulator n=1 Tax=Nocardioides yefusunii TaxID=2500546 RepID=A0ABW1QSW3_9ACTN|nr:GntR family transcriptional regulator [Nocardioides yefusunii]
MSRVGWQPLRVRSVADQVADALRGELRERARVGALKLPPETELAEQLGISRGSLRLALRRLAAEGIVESRRGARGGTFVVDTSPARAADPDAEAVTVDAAMAGRMALEVSAVRAAAVDPRVADRWNELVDDERYSFERNRAFHESLLRATGGPLWTRMAEPWFEWALVVQARHPEPPCGTKVRDDHREIVDAVRACDADLAGEAMIRHLKWVGETYRG